MAGKGLGLRGKSLLALLVACLLALLPALLIGSKLAAAARSHFGQAYARDYTLLNRERILAPLSRELALSQRLADSPLLWRMLRDPDAANRAAFFEEARGYQQALSSGTYFVISALDLGYYFNEAGKPTSELPRYHLHADDPEDGWFFATLRSGQPYNINVNYDAKLRQTRVWINVVAQDGRQKLGIAGSGVDLSGFLHALINRAEPGVVPMIVDAEGAIQAHPDQRRVALNLAQKRADAGQTLAGLLPGTDPAALSALLQRSRAQPDVALLQEVRQGRAHRLLAVSFIPELHWHVVTLVDLQEAQIIGGPWLLYLGLGMAAVLVVLLAGVGYSIERLMLRPLRALQRSAEAIAQGHYEADLPAAGKDEIGALSRAFASMAAQVRAHTSELEDKVRERTAALEASHAQVVQAHKKIDDSIDYASLIQRTILPDRELAQVLGENHHVLWKPRDVVGGDFYVFRADERGFLLGVMDCAGHGVPGALMTMLARSAIDHALGLAGLRDPAGILRQADATLRELLADAQLARAVATNTDAGLVYVDRIDGELLFAGAAIGLFHSDGDAVEHVPSSRRPLGDRRRGDYANVRMPLRAGTTYCLVTDGLLDQAGGEQGFGFGSGRFRQLLQANARRPLSEQAAALAAALADYQGDYPQRDDITVLSFRLD